MFIGLSGSKYLHIPRSTLRTISRPGAEVLTVLLISAQCSGSWVQDLGVEDFGGFRVYSFRNERVTPKPAQP